MAPFGNFHHHIHDYRDYKPSSVTAMAAALSSSDNFDACTVTSPAGTHGGNGRTSCSSMPSFLFGFQNEHKFVMDSSSALNSDTSFLSPTSPKPLSGKFGTFSDKGIAHQFLTTVDTPPPYDSCVDVSAGVSADNLGAMDDDISCMDILLEGAQSFQDCGGGTDKKGRRLGFEQVKALEKAFEIDNRLEPERKLRLAGDLGLQPRQVAVWFQNRRARWKTKQMERDYNVLRSKFETLKADRDKLLMEREKLQLELKRLQSHGESTANGQRQSTNALKTASDERRSPGMFASCLVDIDRELQPPEMGDEKPVTAVPGPLMANINIATQELEAINREQAIDRSVPMKKIDLMEDVMTTHHNESLTSSTDEYNSDDGGAIVDSSTSNNSLNVEGDKATNVKTAYNQQLYANHWRLAANPMQAIEDTEPTPAAGPNGKPEAIWGDDDLPSSNSIPFNMLPSDWYNW